MYRASFEPNGQRPERRDFLRDVWRDPLRRRRRAGGHADPEGAGVKDVGLVKTDLEKVVA